MRLEASENMPKAVRILGWAGVMPFATLSLAILFDLPAPVARLEPLLIAYGAVILSFMGGVHWGLAMKAPIGESRGKSASHYLLSVTPALVGWAATAMAATDAYIVLAAAFLALLLVDMSWTSGRRAPAWYGSLRLQLTAAVLISLGVAWTSA